MRMRRQSVCLIRLNFYPDPHVGRDARALAVAGYDVHVIAVRLPGEPWRDIVDGVSVYRMPVPQRRGGTLLYAWKYCAFFVLAMLTVMFLHVRKRLRVVEIDNMPDFMVFTAIVPKLTGAKVVLYIFDNMPELLMRTRNVSSRHPLARMLMLFERASSRFADHVIVTQEIAKQLMQSRGVAAKKLTVVLNGPDERLFVPRPPQDRERRVGRFEIVTHGAILERYGIQVLIDALPEVLRAIPEANVQIFGAGEYRAELERRVLQADLREHVHFRGFVPLDELLDNIANADVGYVGMLCDLMLSNKLMEYVALGIPVALARWSTYEHYFPDSTVRYFSPGDVDDVAAAMLDIYHDAAAARERAEHAAALYQDYHWPVQKGIYLDLYKRLISGETSPGVPYAERTLQSTP